MRIGTTILENSLAVSTDTKHTHFLELTEKAYEYLSKDRHKYVQSSILVKAKYWKKTKYLSKMEWINKLGIFTLWETI